MSKTGQLIVLVNIRVPADTRAPIALVQLPLGLNLPGGAKLQIDDGKAIDLQIQTCETRGCYASTPVAADMLAALKSGKQLKVLFQNPVEGNDHDPDAARRLRHRLRQDQIAQFDAPHWRAISALPTPSPSSFWSSCITTVTRDNVPVNSNGAA